MHCKPILRRGAISLSGNARETARGRLRPSPKSNLRAPQRVRRHRVMEIPYDGFRVVASAACWHTGGGTADLEGGGPAEAGDHLLRSEKIRRANLEPESA